MTVARGDEHTFVTGKEGVEGWGKSTAKLSATRARITFVALHSSADAAAGTQDAILQSAGNFARLTGRDRFIEAVDLQERKVVVVYTEPLANVIF
jgi:hypothetical protein